MRIAACISISIVALTLSACGGGSGGSVASAPPPSAPVPSPTPTPSSAQDYTGRANSALAITSARQSADPPLVQNSGSLGDALKITREADGGYSIAVMIIEDSTVGLNTIPVQLVFPVSSRTNPTGNPNVLHFVSAAGSRSAELTVNLNGTNHVKFASLTVCNKAVGSGCGPSEYSGSQIVFGSPTPLAEIPLSGSASYAGVFNIPSTTSFNDIAEGNIALNVDFGSRNVSGTLNNVSLFDGEFSVGVPDLALAGQVASTGLLSGTLTPGAASQITGGSWAANFFGPNAAEIGGTIQLNGGPAISSSFFAGTFGATRH